MEDTTNPVDSDRDLLPPPFKKRKIHRRRPQSEEEEDDGIRVALPSTANAPEIVTLDELSHDADARACNAQEPSLSVAEILRHRKAIQRRKGGIEFRALDTASKSDTSESRAISSLLDKDEAMDKIVTVVDRFAPQTGQVADVDQHMYAIPHFALLGSMMHILT
jgi:hypothetical protein